MANLRFHEKYHGTLHHTVSSPGAPGSGTDPIASKYNPFKGNFHLNAELLSASGNATVLGDLALGLNVDDTTCRLGLKSDTTKNGGIQFGTDVFMYRSAVSSFKVETDQIFLDGELNVAGDTLFSSDNVSINTSTTDAVLDVNATTSSDDPLTLKVGGEDKFTVKGSGNVGIGHTSPDYPLEVKGTISIHDGAGESNGRLFFDEQGHNYGFSLLQTGTANPTIDGIAFNPLPTNTFYIIRHDGTTEGVPAFALNRSTGNVGIGTTAPTVPLTIYKAVNPSISIVDSDANDFGFNLGVTAGHNAELWNYDNAYIRFGTNNAERVRITAAGNVGIGTTTPLSKLTIHGTGGYNTNTNAGLRLDNSAFATGDWVTYQDDSGYFRITESDGTDHLVFGYNGSAWIGATDPSKGIYIDGSGDKVVIQGSGSGAAPIIGNYKLDVQGPLVQSTNQGSSFYSLGLRRSSETLQNPDIYDQNGFGLVLGRSSGEANITISQSTSAGETVTGVGINKVPQNAKALDVEGDVHITGDLHITGPQIAIDGTISLTDPVVSLGTIGETTNDGLDRGLMFVYGNGSAALSGFAGMDRAQGNKFVFYPVANWSGTDSNNATGNLGGSLWATIEATSNITSYGDLTVEDDAYINKLKSCNTADITTLNTNTILPLAGENINYKAKYSTFAGTDNDSTIAINAVASDHPAYSLYATGTNFLHTLYLKALYFSKRYGSHNPNSSNSSGNLFPVLNSSGDTLLRFTTPEKVRQALNLADSATTSIATIRGPLLEKTGGTITGDTHWQNNNLDWLRIKGSDRTVRIINAGDRLGLILEPIKTDYTTSPSIMFRTRHNTDRGWRMFANDNQFWIQGHYSTGSNATRFRITHSGAFVNEHKIWHEGNLDPTSYGVYKLYPGGVTNGILTAPYFKQGEGKTTGSVTIDQDWLNACVVTHPSQIYTAKVWSTLNHGSGSNLDADKVDGLHASSMLRSDSRTAARKGIRMHPGYNTNHAGSTHQPYDHYGIYEESTHPGDNHYRTQYDSWRHPYAKLAINHHTGINYRATDSYGGHQFYNKTYGHSMMTNLCFSVARGDRHVRIHGATKLMHRDTDGTQHEYLHQGNMTLVNANTLDGRDSTHFLGRIGDWGVGAWGNGNNCKRSHITSHTEMTRPTDDESAWRYDHNSGGENGFWCMDMKGHSATMFTYGDDDGSTARVQLASMYWNEHFIRTKVDRNNRWENWAKLWTSKSLTGLSQLSNDAQYVRYPANNKYEMDQAVNASSSPQFNMITTTRTGEGHWGLVANSGIEIKDGSTMKLWIYNDHNNEGWAKLRPEGGTHGVMIAGRGARGDDHFLSVAADSGNVGIGVSPDAYAGLNSNGLNASGTSTGKSNAKLHIKDNRYGNTCMLRLESYEGGDKHSDLGPNIDFVVRDTNSGPTACQIRAVTPQGTYGDENDLKLAFMTTHDGNMYERMVVMGNGRVGINLATAGQSVESKRFRDASSASGNNHHREPRWALDVRGKIVNRESGGTYGPVYLESWGLSNHNADGGTGNIYFEPKAGKGIYLVPMDWSQNLFTTIYGRVYIGGPGGSYAPGDRGLGVHGDIKSASNGYFGGDITAYYSDRRLKKDFVRLEGSSELVKKLTGYRFAWNDKARDIVPDDHLNKSQVGLIAQDVEDVLPEAVTTNGPRDAAYKTIKYDKLVPILVEALKEQIDRNDALESRLEKLEKLITNK